MPDDYDVRHQRYFSIRLSTAIETLAEAPIDRLPLELLDQWIRALLRECTAVYNGTCGEVIRGYRKAELFRSTTAATYQTPCKTVMGATLMHPELPLLGVAQGQKVAAFSLEQLILDFERIHEPAYDTAPETNDEQARERARVDIEELKEVFRRKEQRRRDPP
ncbi:unnamed protein product [Heligmosomoides polygyrus]|uniref:DUF4338 domain-containing protein n=1 Tax=Heligmosomoides polygyrus TaxID=6339 RepID=A0A183FRC4_HELPZ|nr:unnamed protein product [Heligmosomoides polygyrus]